MIDFFAISGFLFWSFVILLPLLVLSDVYENGFWAAFLIAVFIGVQYKWGDTSFFSYVTIVNAVLYLCTGFIYALFRCFYAGTEEDRTESLTRRYGDDYARQAKLTYIKSNITRWWLLFPISLPVLIFKDLFSWLGKFIYKYTGKLFLKVYEYGESFSK